MNDKLRVPNESDAKVVARLLSEGSPEPIGRLSAQFAIHEKGAR